MSPSSDSQETFQMSFSSLELGCGPDKVAVVFVFIVKGKNSELKKKKPKLLGL